MHEHELIGVTLGTCTIERLIGKGGMALVFLAQQARPTRTVAVKVLLSAEDLRDPEQERVFLERFRREADTVAKLEHRHVLPIYEYDEATVNGQHLPYLVMPYLRGGSLRQRIDEMKHTGRQFDLHTVAELVEQVADALSYAQALGVVHRDIKPGNLLFHSDGRLILTDFGIARLSAMPALTMAGSFIGTAEYASPEQVNAAELDARSDIYALGIILYELLTGSVPFTGFTPFEIMARHLHEPLPSLRAQRPDLSPALEFVVKKALAKDPRDRYQQATELSADLQAALTPALAQQMGLRLGGDANNSDLTVADNSPQPPARVLAPTAPAPVQAALPATPAVVAPARTPLPPTQAALPAQPPAGGAPRQPAQGQVGMYAAPNNQTPTYRLARRLAFTVVALVTLVLQLLTLALTLNHNLPGSPYGDPTATTAGVLLGNGLNLLALAAIGFTGIVRRRDIRGIFNRTLWVAFVGLILSSFFIDFGAFSSAQQTVPFVSWIILLLTNIYALRALSKTDARQEQIEVAPILWRSAIVGALTGLIPLVIILSFAFMVPLLSGSALFMRLLGVLVIAFIGAPTPGAMMAVWLSRKMSFSSLVRTSGVAGFFMFLAAYVLVLLIGLLSTGHALFSASFSQDILLLALGILGGLLGLIGLLRGMFDAWIYHRFMLRRP